MEKSEEIKLNENPTPICNPPTPDAEHQPIKNPNRDDENQPWYLCGKM